MRTAIVGTGFVAELHVQVLRELGQEITAVVNPTMEKAQRFAQKWDAQQAFSTLASALSRSKVDCVHICTPPVSHTELLNTCLAADVSVFCEKPLTVDAEQARTITQLAQEKEIITAVNFNNRRAVTAAKTQRFFK